MSATKDAPTPQPKTNMSSEQTLFFLSAFRLCNALLVQTFFQPDEYFQSLDPAWQIAFGADSGAWITWEWKERLRPSLHPFLFASVYYGCSKAIDLLGLNPRMQAEVLLAAPKVLQALFAAVTDYFTWRLAIKVFGRSSKASQAALALSICSPWQWFVSTRTLSNCLETMLTTVALCYWPLDLSLLSTDESRRTGKQYVSPCCRRRVRADWVPRLRAALLFAAIATILRPTNAIIWAVVVGPSFLIASAPRRPVIWHVLLSFLQETILAGLAVLMASAVADRYYYGQWTFPPIRFINFNVVQSLAVFYGQNRPDYYFTEGLPLLLTTALPFACTGVWRGLRGGLGRPQPTDEQAWQTVHFTRSMSLAAMTLVAVLSFVSHKEVRFIYPLLPVLHVLAADPLASFFSPFPWPRVAFKKLLLAFLLSFNVALAAYASMVHQRGVIDVTHYLRHEHERRYLAPSRQHTFGAGAAGTTAAFLMPCHSTPWRSHLVHPNISAWALTCEPPLHVPVSERGTYMDEADQFYASPDQWLAENMVAPSGAAPVTADHEATGKRQWPEYLVFFEQLESTLVKYLQGSKYRQCWRGFNSHFHDDWRRKGDVIVWCLDHEHS